MASSQFLVTVAFITSYCFSIMGFIQEHCNAKPCYGVMVVRDSLNSLVEQQRHRAGRFCKEFAVSRNVAVQPLRQDAMTLLA